MKANIFINFYQDKQPTRQHELEACLLKNIENKELDRIIIVISKEDKDYLKELVGDTKKVYVAAMENRPSYNFYFKLTHQYPDDINIIANTDIVIEDDTIKKLKGWDWKNYCLALSRWDYTDNSMSSVMSKHHAHRDSQDVWAVKGRFKSIPEANFPLGKKGCDNRIAYLLDKHYILINPSQSIRTFHYHLTNIRNYAPHGTNEDLVPPPYHFVNTSKLPI